MGLVILFAKNHLSTITKVMFPTIKLARSLQLSG
jgi:hypothetical protein